jgi:hypothetical protein
MSDYTQFQQESNNLNYDGGSSSGGTYNQTVQGGSNNPVFTPGVCTFTVRYSNVALTREQLPVIDWTFKYKNQPAVFRYFKSSFNVCLQSNVMDTLNLTSFFHPFLSFSSYQKQTFVIDPDTTIDIDTSNFAQTLNEVSFILARAYYLPTQQGSARVLFWDYGGVRRYPMGEIMVLTGAVKEGSNWRGWDISPFANYGHTGPVSNPSLGGISFTNPTTSPVKLVVITAN